MNLDAPLSSVLRLSPTHQAALKRLGLVSVRDLLWHLPVRYTDTTRIKAIRDVLDGEEATVYGTLSNLTTKKAWKSKIPMATATLSDMSGSIKVVWFRQAYLAKMLHEGGTVQLTGPVKADSHGLTMANPAVEERDTLPIDIADSLFDSGKVKVSFGYPVYKESRGVTSRFIYHAIQKILSSGLLDQIEDPLPERIRTTYNLPPLGSAIAAIHAPKSPRDAEAARKRLAFDEIFGVQVARARERASREDLKSYALPVTSEVLGDFAERLPFELTEGQEDAIEAITDDIAQGRPMARLLEGDVGSGKTAIAAMVAYAAVMTRPEVGKNFGNIQVAYMAPTEILATQLFETFIKFFNGIPIQIGLITGSGCRKFPSKVAQGRTLGTKDQDNPTKWWTEISRTQLLKWVASGEIAILIGTHALVQKSVAFKHLGLAIIDEQHRFGTNQRSKLARKEGFAPHLLSMTATPIPRTLALTIYGDLDLTVLDQMPAGRKPVITKIVEPHARDACYEHMRTELAAGRQVYVICPRIDEPDPTREAALQAKSVISEAERLGTKVFPGKRVGILHSKMTKQNKEKIMEEFLAHSIDILVATSVVEVGVNVPNATVILIEGAERFGLAQLHQLRGRVLRGTHQAYCYLATDSTNKTSHERLNALVRSANGFELAEQDLMLRGAGELGGGKQWGISDIGMEALRNPKLVEFARTEARKLVDEDPDLVKHPALRELIESRHAGLHFE